jgi:hypothetical protein
MGSVLLDEQHPHQPAARRLRRPGFRQGGSYGRVRRIDYMSSRRAPFARRIARPAKLKRNRHSAAEIPAHIRAVGAALDAGDRAYLRRKLGMKLGKFARAIERVSVRVRDVNGPRGGIDKLCAVKVTLIRLPSVVVEHKHASLQGAMDGALRRVEVAVRRGVQRRTTRAR